MTWITIPTVTAASIGGAIYYVIKNTRSIQKEYFTVAQFNEEAKKIRLYPEILGSLEASSLYDDFKKGQSKANQRIEEYKKEHQEIDWTKVKINNYKYARLVSAEKKEKNNRIIKNLPKPFDAHEYLKSKIKVNLDFEKTKYLDFKFTDLEKINNEDTKLRIHYVVFLNYQYATGNFEPKSKRYTKNSKYYYENSDVVTFYSNDLKIFSGSKFAAEWQKNKANVEKIIRELNEKNKEIDKKIEHLEAKLKESNSNNEEISKQIEQLKEDKKKVFINPKFYDDVFEWFKKTIEITDAFSDNYRKEDGFVIEAYNKNNEPYIIWNPTKGLNELTIKFIFIKKDNMEEKTIRSYPKAIIFTLDNV
ncbi:hypothetical protein BCF89_10257 [Metamycoplasma auris]|uniref:Uncharacterized protein n=2 Tax=Metamycoplasma auris TaxID=51363 RepID=A0A2W7GUL2_9BACT|nr:hypothetical protein BCF89_10257 [Metamycoplasma auris]